MPELVVPSWFKQRQGKADPAGAHIYRLTGPNLEEAFIWIAQSDGSRWASGVRKDSAGADLEATGADFDFQRDAWEAAFELYRRHFVV